VTPRAWFRTTFFPRGVRVWHFILVPPLAMAVVLGAFRIVDRLILPLAGAGPPGEIYQTARTILIGLAMTAVIAALAVHYRTGYERQLLERERLAAVGELAAMVAHEVRNPLAGIRGGCEILLEGYAPGDPRHEIGVEIIRQVDRLTRTVHDLLTFARPRAADPVPTDIHALIDRVVQNVRDDPRNGEVEVVRDFGPGVPVVHVDGRQMEQVFLNLALNAVQAMKHAGRVTITTRAAHRRLTVAVADSGPGIPAGSLDHVFQPFFTTRAQGTGLGLAIVKKIVEAHGGGIEAASPPGTGAVFTVTLPCEAR
jgi:signal transduction histidine kinase